MIWLLAHRGLKSPLYSSVRGYLSSTGILLWIKRDCVLGSHLERIIDLQCGRHRSLVVPINGTTRVSWVYDVLS
nr:MAG TPA: hypothetical protein [Caudoviricetes sp.]